MDLENAPWNSPVPVRKSTFTPLRPRDAAYNIETDLTPISNFYLAKKPIPSRELLHCDQQTNPVGNVPRRAGSGRAGFYKDKYVKGCGRTPLALNWNDNDAYHNTGHLFPTGALREYLVSRYLEAKGAGHTIVPCEGLLLRPLPKHLRNVGEKALPKGPKGVRPARIDGLFQAITYKAARGGFARASNFAWFLDHAATLPQSAHAFDAHAFFTLLIRYLKTIEAETPAKEGSVRSPEKVAELYAESLERTMANLGEFFRTGVYWGSFHNNFTLDGRFLDLEVPQIFCGPLLGKISRENRKRISGYVTGGFTSAPFFLIAAQLRAQTEYLRSRLGYIVDNGFFAQAQEGEFLRSFLKALRKAVDPKRHWIYHKEPTIRRAFQLMEMSLPLSPAERKALRPLLESHWARCNRHGAEKPRMEFERVSMPEVRGEGAVHMSWYTPGILLKRVDYLDEARWFHSRMAGLENSRDVGALLQGVLDFEKEIRAYCRQQ